MTSNGTRKLFGTDGIRAVAGEAPLDPTTIYSVGLALAHSLRKKSTRPKVLIGRDTRESGPWIAATLAEALRQAGATVESAGIVTTPAVAFLAKTHGFDAGVVISASHNPWADNGIKLFGADGFKFPDAAELAMEEEILFHSAQVQIADPHCFAPVEDNTALQSDYIQFLIDCVPGLSLSGLKIVADCANGAAAAIAPELLRRLSGSKVSKLRFGHLTPEIGEELLRRLNADARTEITLLNTTPDGRNINANCGALHPEFVAREVKSRGADLGLTFDGDADRCMMAGAEGNVINGDAILLMAARDLKARGLLTGDLVVATTMSNMGLEAALKRSGIRMLRAPVGDRYVLEEMQKTNAALGGEQSGHILFPHLATTGDGLLTALVVLDLVARTGKSIGDLTADLKVFPQVIVNVQVREKKPLDGIPAVVDAIRAAETELDGTGRVVIRYSGTEPLARVMIEAESEEAMRRHAEAIAAAIRNELGV
jgi:phosphoglucosamine mutase